jgi:predicted GH43/DUF377 family glycosyl hydrolase
MNRFVRSREVTAMATRRTVLQALLGAGLSRADDLASPYLTQYKIGRLVLTSSGEGSDFDSRSVDCPFVFEHDGLFYMTYVGFDGSGYQTGLASSRDLVQWRKLGCILKRNPDSPITRHNVAMNWIVRDNKLRSRGSLKKIRGRFLGVYHAYPNAGYESGPAVIGLCWSDDLFQWSLDEPCLRPEHGGNWERGGLYKPCLVEHEGTFYLFYNAKTSEPRGWQEQTGVAVTTDLKSFRRYEGNPILPNGGPRSPDERFASDPCVLRDGRNWVMFYYGLDAKGKARDLVAIGDDAYHFRKSDTILVDVGSAGTVDETYAHKPGVIWNNGALYHFYCAVAGRYPNEVRGISVARSVPWS